MKIFCPKEKPENVPENEAELIVNDFTQRTPFAGYRPVSYKIEPAFIGLKAEIDDHLKELFKGDVDSGNADVLDGMIIDRARHAEKDLKRQRSHHIDSIKSFDIRAAGDRKAFESHLTKLNEKLQENLSLQARYKRLLEKDEFISKEE